MELEEEGPDGKKVVKGPMWKCGPGPPTTLDGTEAYVCLYVCLHVRMVQYATRHDELEFKHRSTAPLYSHS